MITVESHKTNDCNRQISVVAHAPSTGGAAVRYDIKGPEKQMLGVGMVPSFGLNMKFQDGPVADGVNGVTNEVLLAIVEDRLKGFQTGPWPSAKNAEAMSYVRSAMEALASRTEERINRGVEGTHAP
jgi:hypothetical protein